MLRPPLWSLRRAVRRTSVGLAAVTLVGTVAVFHLEPGFVSIAAPSIAEVVLPVHVVGPAILALVAAVDAGFRLAAVRRTDGWLSRATVRPGCQFLLAGVTGYVAATGVYVLNWVATGGVFFGGVLSMLAGSALAVVVLAPAAVEAVRSRGVDLSVPT